MPSTKTTSINATVRVRNPPYRMMAAMLNHAGKPMICCPLVIMLARPRAIDIMASVAMKAGTLNFVISNPATSPFKAAAPSAMMIANTIGTPISTLRYPITIMVNAMTEPTARSIPPIQYHQGHSDGHDPQDRDLVQDVQEVADRKESVRPEAEEQAEQQKPDERSGRALHGPE